MSCPKKRTRSKYFPPPPTKEELEQRAKAEEFWSDPCWTEPLNQELHSDISR